MHTASMGRVVALSVAATVTAIATRETIDRLRKDGRAARVVHVLRRRPIMYGITVDDGVVKPPPGARVEFCTFLGGPPKVPAAEVEAAMRGAVADALERIGVTPGPALHFEA